MAMEDPGQRPGGSGTQLLEYIYGVLFSPSSTMRQLAREQPLKLAILVQVSLALLSTALTVFGHTGVGQFMSSSLLLATALMSIAVSLILWVVVTGILQMLAELLGGRSTGLLAVTGFAQLPLLFAPVVAIIGRLLGSWVEGLLGLGLLLWVIVLYGVALRETHDLSASRTVGALALGGGALLTLVFSLILVLVATWQALLEGLVL